MKPASTCTLGLTPSWEGPVPTFLEAWGSSFPFLSLSLLICKMASCQR